MFNPNYKLTSELLKSINTCERLYGQLEASKLPQEIELSLERDNEIKSSYISNSIEGNPLSLPEVTNLLLGDRLPANRDEKEVVNYFNILRSLNKYSEMPISLNVILKIHKELLTGVNDEIAGQIRDKSIVVGKYKTEEGKLKIDIKHNPPAHRKKQIEKMLQDLVKWENKSKDPAVIKAGIFHHEFVYIHPFEDGNGRACRLLTALLFLKAGYQVNKYFVLDDYYDVDRSLYSDSLHSADFGDKTQWLEYFSDGVKYSLQSVYSKAQHSLSTLKVSQRPTAKEQEVIMILQEYKEITAPDLAKHFEVSRQQAHSLLKSLVEKGLVEKKGSTKASYYQLK